MVTDYWHWNTKLTACESISFEQGNIPTFCMESVCVLYVLARTHTLEAAEAEIVLAREINQAIPGLVIKTDHTR